MQEIIEKHKNNKNSITLLQSIQDKYGYIPEKETAEIAKALNIPLVKLWGVATFYSQFRLKKRGKYVIQVCNGTACHVNKSGEIINFLKDELKIDSGETTDDGLITLEIVNCIGACARAPVISVNGKVYGQVDTKSLKKIISELK